MRALHVVGRRGSGFAPQHELLDDMSMSLEHVTRYTCDAMTQHVTRYTCDDIHISCDIPMSCPIVRHTHVMRNGAAYACDAQHMWCHDNS